jgi:prepilin-type N-terminal cleavage/methylation domain-containing protein
MTRARTHLRTRPARRGLTLAELSVSLAVIATLMVAIGSVMVLTGRAVGMSATQAAEARTDDLVATMASEERMALTVTERTPISITFTVADRDHDGQPETIRYAWSGTPGDPLTRQYNTEAAVVIAKDVQKFNINYLTQSAAAATPPADVESTTDDLVFSHETGATTGFAMSTTAWCAQSFIGKLARPDATSWRVTEVQIMGTATGSTTGKSWTVSLCPDLLGKPNTLNPIEQKTLPMSNFATTAKWSSLLPFTNTAQNLNPSQKYWIVVSQSALTTTGTVSFDNSSGDTADPAATTATAGTLWTSYTTRDIKIRVYGRYKYPGP